MERDQETSSEDRPKEAMDKSVEAKPQSVEAKPQRSFMSLYKLWLGPTGRFGAKW